MMNRLIAEHALLPEGWRQNVLLEWDDKGCLTIVAPDFSDAAAETCSIVLPGMPNLHSHAFQRAMAGLAEYRSNPDDNFWSWRTLMYGFIRKLTPPMLKAIALQLYIDMLKSGYTSVCEFHYLHHDADGKPYANPAEYAECLIEAAQEAGIGLTLLPVLYQYSNFGSKPPLVEQARFINSPQWIVDLLQRLQRTHPQHAGLRYGAAPHSLRAVSPESLVELLTALKQWDARAPVHIHIAEQVKEVDDCIAYCGARPVQWLFHNFDVDARWCLVHATHMTESETQALAKCGAVAGLCPTTEANLGDGVFNGAAYARMKGCWGIGSDSHVSTSMCEELRMLEYSQRLQHRQRNIMSNCNHPSAGSYLYRTAQHGGALATARPVAGLSAGQHADLLVLDNMHPDLYGKTEDRLLDSLIFCHHPQSSIPLICKVMAGGRWVVQQGRHALEETSATAYRSVLRDLIVSA